MAAPHATRPRPGATGRGRNQTANDTWNDTAGDPVSRVLDALEAADCEPRRRPAGEYVAKCPVHADKTPSLGLATGEEGRALLVCRAGCETADIVAALGMTLDDLTPAQVRDRRRSGAARERTRREKAPAWRPVVPVPADAPDPPELPGEVERSGYPDAEGRLLGFVARIEPGRNGRRKDYLPQTWCIGPDGRAEWRVQSWPTPRPLYGLHALALRPDAPVIVLEGERSRDAAARMLPDHVAVTSPGGVDGAKSADWTPLRVRHVTVWPDADEPGAKYAADVARLAREAGAASVRVVTLPEGLPKGWDLADPVPDGVDVLALLRDAPPAADDWPPLRELRQTPELPRIGADVLPSWAGEYADALAVATETPPELAVSMVLGACSAAVARRYRVAVRDGYAEPCNLWLAYALPPGSRKSAVQSAATVPLREWEREQADSMREEISRARSNRATKEARAKALRTKAANKGDAAAAEQAANIEAALPTVPVAPRIWTSDTTTEQLGILLAEHGEAIAALTSEGGILDTIAGRYSTGRANLDLLLQAWSGDPATVDRVTRGLVYLTHPRLTLCMSPQPCVLRDLSSSPGFAGRGLLGRMLYLLPPSGIGYRSLETAPIPGRVAEAYSSGLRSLLDTPACHDDRGRETLRTLALTPEAYADWLAAARAIEAMMRPGGRLASMPDWGSKAAGGAVRIAGVLHAIEYADGAPDAEPISRETMGRALDIVAALVEHARAAYDTMGADPETDAAEYVWRWMTAQRAPVVTVRDVQRGCRALPDVAAVEAALGELEERGYVRVTHPRASGPGRPPSSTVTVRPDIVEGWR